MLQITNPVDVTGKIYTAVTFRTLCGNLVLEDYEDICFALADNAEREEKSMHVRALIRVSDVCNNFIRHEVAEILYNVEEMVWELYNLPQPSNSLRWERVNGFDRRIIAD